MTIYVSRINHGHPAEGVKVKAYHGFKLRWRNPRPHRTLSTRMRITLRFEREEAGKRIEMSAAWMNPRL